MELEASSFFGIKAKQGGHWWGDTGGILFFGLDTRNHYYDGKLVVSWFASDEIKGVKNWGHPSFFGRRIFVASSFAGLA